MSRLTPTGNEHRDLYFAPLEGQNDFMNRFLLSLLMLALPSAALALPQPLTGADRANAIASANRALGIAGPLKGRFVQIDSRGKTAGGSFYLQRPGKVRFAYDAPNPLTIVSDGSIVSLEDSALKTVNRAPLKTTPLYLLLKRDVNIERDAKVTSVAKDGDSILVGLRDPSGQTNGDLTLTFDGPARELRQWRVTDAAGNVTLTALQTVQAVPALDQKLFETKAPTPTGARAHP
ncbi:MAG TPA: outer-membrane lipoprotein carrier protein LolA [Caulobacterales bacterium]|nr:outer-membrane lipoprotein carrier protein LolA [Caulobacterales bacterium]